MSADERYRKAIEQSRWQRAEEIAYLAYRPVNGPRDDAWLNRYATISRINDRRRQLDDLIQTARDEVGCAD